ncbi:protein strawberry notch homolog 1-like isoform X3 [Porites lutea]|uniref:protein strawberry notch homolog 1-like isoform X3 n=1 Tax=Porites lutea TaxID=51062 RepID=UPI003CC588DB
MSEANEPDFFGQDLLSEALGQSGLNLDEFFGNAPGSVLSQSIFDVGDIGPNDSDFLDNINLGENLSQDSPFITFAAQNNGPISSSSASTLEKPQVTGIQTTFLDLQETLGLPNLISQGSIFDSPGQSVLTSQSQQGASKISSPLGLQRLQNSNSSPLLLNLLNSENSSSSSVANSSNDTKRELTRKDVSRLWSNHDVTLNQVSEIDGAAQHEDEEDEEEEELGHTDTYADYVPSKLRIGRRHPDPVVETSSLSSVTPPNIWYRLTLPQEVIDYCYLSALQLEAIVYACQQHETFLADGSRAGFLIGDGAGVGKGRTVAGIIYENYLLGRKRAIWLSISNDLKYDAERDLRDIGCSNIHVSSLNKFKYDAKISSKVNNKFKKGVVFATYSSLIGESQATGKYNSRMSQLLHWCGRDFDGVIILDECHKAKNLVPTGSSKPTKTGLAVLELQNKLPKARVVYCSATGASEPKNMAYMSRLGIWGLGTPFREFSDFIQAVERRGVGAMEIVAMDMKLRGMYMTRQLSFNGVTFDIKELPLTKDFIDMYDASVKLWTEAREKFEKAADLMAVDNRTKKTVWGQFWSAHQCIIVGLQSTGEASTLEQLDEAGGELTDFVSTAKGVLQALIKKQFPAPDRKVADLFGINDFDSGMPGRSSPAPGQLTPKKRKKPAPKAPKPKRVKTALERIYNLSSGSDSDSDDSERSTADIDLSCLIRNDVNNVKEASPNSNDSSAGEDDFNPFGNSGSDDEDPWLHRKNNKNPKSKSQTGSADSNGIDPSYSALAAAGLRVGSLPWSIPRLKNGGLDSPALDEFPLLTGHLRTLHQSASAPALSTLMSSANSPAMPSSSAAEQCRHMKKELLDKVDILSRALPPNTLDKLIDDLGGPENVAEMTGRKGRVVSNDDGTVSYESRSKQDVPLEILNIAEKKRFMDGEKNIAIISEAASSGISLQADRRAKNQRRRVHITLELPWSADKAIQQFGRSHRSNQVSAPEYLFLISELAGERRFASIVAKRLESLGALTHGDRRATESQDLSRYNFDNKYGRAALEAVLKAVTGQAAPMIPPPQDYNGPFFQDIRTALIGVGLVVKDEKSGLTSLEKGDYSNMSRFLNRILGIKVELQNRLFAYFMKTLSVVIQQEKRNGRWDEGILDLGAHGEAVNNRSVETFVGNSVFGTATTELHTVSVERGVSWEESFQLRTRQSQPADGYYLSNQSRNGKKYAILVICQSRSKKKNLYSVYRPNTGLQTKQDSLEEIKKKYKKVSDAEAKASWDEQYNSALTQCIHAYGKGNCKRMALGLTCEVGKRQRTFHILSGSVLSVWSKLESVLAGQPGANSKVQIVRCRKSDGSRIVGCLIPSNCVPALARTLSPDIVSEQKPIIIAE